MRVDCICGYEVGDNEDSCEYCAVYMDALRESIDHWQAKIDALEVI